MARDLTWDYQEQIQLAVRARLELWASELQVQHSNLSATLPIKQFVKLVVVGLRGVQFWSVVMQVINKLIQQPHDRHPICLVLSIIKDMELDGVRFFCH